MKEKIYAKVNKKYSNLIPGIDNIRRYINLHWGMVALKQKQFLIGLNMLLPAAFYPPAWQLFLEATTSSQTTK